jgi:hypothetical protein
MNAVEHLVSNARFEATNIRYDCSPATPTDATAQTH